MSPSTQDASPRRLQWLNEAVAQLCAVGQGRHGASLFSADEQNDIVTFKAQCIGGGAPHDTRTNYESFQRSIPGFISWFGSKARLIRIIKSISSDDLYLRNSSRLSCPIPCSALMLPL